jgi:hypothetical protein
MKKRAGSAVYVFFFLLLTSTRTLLGNQIDGPQLTAVEPSAGITTPGSKVRVYGKGFASDTVV